MAEQALVDGKLTATNATTLQAGVKATKTYNMTNALADVVVTAKTAGYWGNSVQVRFVDPGANDQALSVDVQGKIITVNLKTGAAGAIESTGAEVVAALTASAAALALVDCVDEGDGSGVVNALAIAALAGGLDAIVCYEGAKIIIEAIDLDGLNIKCRIENPRNRDLVYASEICTAAYADLITAITP